MLVSGRSRLRRTAGTLLLAALWPCGESLARPPQRISFDEAVVRASRIEPGAEALFIGISKENRPFEARLSTYCEILTDTDEDGVVEFQLDRPISAGSVWAVVDLSSGSWSIAGPEGSPMRPKRGRGAISLDETGALRRLVDAGDVLEFFVARPGIGAWRGAAGDGGPQDESGDSDGVIQVILSDLQAIGQTGEFDELLPGDVVFSFESRRLEFSVGRVRGGQLDDLSEGEDD